MDKIPKNQKSKSKTNSPENTENDQNKELEEGVQDSPTICVICLRELGDRANEHHLIPKSLGGKETILIHEMCHSKIHHTFTERELKNTYHTIKKIMEHEAMQKFAKWIKNKPIDYKDKNKDTKERKRKRKYQRS